MLSIEQVWRGVSGPQTLEHSTHPDTQLFPQLVLYASSRTVTASHEVSLTSDEVACSASGILSKEHPVPKPAGAGPEIRRHRQQTLELLEICKDPLLYESATRNACG